MALQQTISKPALAGKYDKLALSSYWTVHVLNQNGILIGSAFDEALASLHLRDSDVESQTIFFDTFFQDNHIFKKQLKDLRKGKNAEKKNGGGGGGGPRGRKAKTVEVIHNVQDQLISTLVALANAEPLPLPLQQPLSEPILEPKEHKTKRTYKKKNLVPTVEPVIETPVEPVIETPVEPVIETPVEPVIETPVEPVIEAPVEPVIETPVEPVIETPVEPVIETPVEPVIEAPISQTLDSFKESKEKKTKRIYKKKNIVPTAEHAPITTLAVTEPIPELASEPFIQDTHGIENKEPILDSNKEKVKRAPRKKKNDANVSTETDANTSTENKEPILDSNKEKTKRAPRKKKNDTSSDVSTKVSTDVSTNLSTEVSSEVDTEQTLISVCIQENSDSFQPFELSSFHFDGIDYLIHFKAYTDPLVITCHLFSDTDPDFQNPIGIFDKVLKTVQMF
jgi:hypothetical protein